MPDRSGESFKNQSQLSERLDRMIASGQVTGTEAAQLRTAETGDDFDAAVTALRTRHAGARLRAPSRTAP